MNVGCPVRRTVMTFCFCLRFMLEPSLCLASLQTRSLEYLNRYEITKSWQCNSGHASDLRVFGPLLSLSTPFSRLFRTECTLSSYHIARSRLFAHVFAHVWSSSLNCPSFPFLSGVCVHLLITSSFCHHIPVTFVTFTTTSLLDAFTFSHGGPWHIK